MVKIDKMKISSTSNDNRAEKNPELADDTDSEASRDSCNSTERNWELEEDNDVVVLSDSDNENAIMKEPREVIQEEMQTDEEDELDADADGVEVLNEDDDEEEDDEEEAEENVRTERQRREDVWYPKSVHEIEQATRIHSGEHPLRDEDKVSASNFDVIQVLGTGAYGKVFLVRKIDGVDAGTLYAMKVLKKCTVISKKKTAEHTKTERQVLEKIRHKPFLAGMHYAFTDDCHLYIVLDYVCGGELFTHLYHREKFLEKDLRIYIAELIIALEQLHELGVIYRDIKLENVLIDKDGHIVLTDFGLSRELTSLERAQSYCGTMEYMAPEIVKSETYGGHDYMADWWSVGVLLIELLTGSSPFAIAEGAKQEEITNRILNEEPHINGNPSVACRDLINKLLDKNPHTRIGSGKKKSEEIKKHPFFKGINWQKLKNKQYPPAIIPKIENELDTQNFSEEFTSLPVINSPGSIPENTQHLFRGFSYTGSEFCQAGVSENNDEPHLEEIEDQPQEADSSMDQLNEIISKIPDVSDKYQITNTKINSGSFADCYKAFYFEKNENCAAKAMSYRAYQPGEVDCLRKLEHKNIVKFYDVVKTSSYIYLVMEFLEGGELYDFVRNSPLERLEENTSKNIVKQIASALEYMHSNNYLHRDIKPENIMFTDEKHECVKLIDFGFSSFIENGEPFTSDPRYTLDYAPPEIIRANENNSSLYCKGNDIWSLGTVIYTMVVGHPPFRHKEGENDEETVRERILECDYDKNETWLQLSSSVQKLILKTFDLDPENRISASEILTLDWFEPSISEPELMEISLDVECDDDDSSISAGDLDSIISIDDEEVENVAIQNVDEESLVLLEAAPLPGDVQSTEENNNMKNGEKSEGDESELDNKFSESFEEDEATTNFEADDLKSFTNQIESLEFDLPKSLKFLVMKKVVNKKESTNILPSNHSVPIKKRHNYFKSPDEPVVQISIANDTSNKDDLELIGFNVKLNTYQARFRTSDLLLQYDSSLCKSKKGRTSLLLSDFKITTSRVTLYTAIIKKKVFKAKTNIKKKESKAKTIDKTTNKPIKPIPNPTPLRRRRDEIHDLTLITFSPRKTRRSAAKREEKPLTAVETKKPTRKVIDQQNGTKDVIAPTSRKASNYRNPLASTSRAKPKIAVVKPLRKRKTEEDTSGGPAEKRPRGRHPNITTEDQEGEDKASTSIILVKESY